MRRIATVSNHCAVELQHHRPLGQLPAAPVDFASLPSVPGNIVYTGPSGEGEEHAAVQVFDGRMAPERFSLDASGFQLLSLDRPLAASFSDPADVHARVYPEAERYLLQTTGAQKVLVFDHILRDGALLQSETEAGIARGDARSTPFLGGPILQAHNDYTVRSGFTRARQLLEPYVAENTLEAALQGRFSIVNFWCPLEQVTCAPLAMCDWSSAKPAHVRTVRYVYEHRLGEVYRVLRSPEHVWVCFSSMRPDEAILLKTFDSRSDVARFALHTAVDLVEGQGGASPILGAEGAGRLPEQRLGLTEPGASPAQNLRNRRSLELRCVVFYEALPEGFARGFSAPHLQPNSHDADARLSLKRVELLPASDEW